MDGLGGFILGFFAGTLIAIISIALNITTSGTITIEPVKDDYKNEIIYYVDIHTKKTYKMENDILHYCEEWVMNEEEKKAVEFVKKRTKELKKYAKRENELVYDDIILNLIEKLQKENESWKSYSEELEEEQIEKNNKNCELEFEVEKLQKENEEYSRQLDLDYVDKNYISKQKIKDEIEELKGKLEDISKRREKSKTKEEKTVLWCLEIRTDERIKTLQELL